MKKIIIIRLLEKYPLFTLNEFVRLTGKKVQDTRNYLYRLRKEGLIFRIERGKYTAIDNPVAFASCIAVPSYISFWTAIRHYNLTEQMPKDIMVAVPKPKKSLTFRGTKIRFFTTKQMWGYGKQRYGNFDIMIAEAEKAVIDSMLLKNVPFDEIVKAVKSGETDKNKLISYTLRTKNSSLGKRLGFMLETFGFKAEELLNLADNNYVLLDWYGRKEGKKDKRWKLIINRSLDDIA